MNLLLDTHVFIWWDCGSDRLGDRARALIANPTHSIFVSAASIWEIAIKRRLGKLAFDGSAAAAIAKNAFIDLPVSSADAEAAGALDWAHGDPFDRLIVAQAQARGLSLVTADAVMRQFDGVSVVAAA